MEDRRNWAVCMTKIVSRLALYPFFSLKAEGKKNVPQKSAFVLLAKHQRWEDIPLIGLACPRPLYYVAKFELFKNPFSKCLLKSLGGIPLNRQRPIESRESIGSVIKLLRGGKGLVIFPEGTYYRDRMGPGHSGMVRLILTRSSPLFVPVGVNYCRKGWRTRVRVKFGKTFHTDSEASATALLDHVMESIARLSALDSGMT